MSASDSDIKQWPDPKDYGLPFVEIIPIRPKVELVPLPSEIEISTPVSIAESSSEMDIPVVLESNPDTLALVDKPETAAPKQQKIPVSSGSAEEKKSSTWVWSVIVIALGIVAVIIWQILANNKNTEVSPAFEIVEKPVAVNTAPTTEVDTETTVTDQNQATVNQDSIQSPDISNPNISKPAESGTTIANTATGNLIRVESKAERPQYFIIVGSLPNQKMALEEANRYFGKTAELYLIFPVDEDRNYRLGLSKFESFRDASAKLEEIKSQYTEELWILKY